MNKKEVALASIKTASTGEPNYYEWTDITQEFFEAVKGNSIIVLIIQFVIFL